MHLAYFILYSGSGIGTAGKCDKFSVLVTSEQKRRYRCTYGGRDQFENITWVGKYFENIF